MLSIFPPQIKAIILMIIALTCGYLHIKHVFHEKLLSKLMSLWSLLSAVAFFSGNIWFLILSIVFVCLYKIPKIGTERVHYYLALLPALPGLPYEIPGFFGIRFIFLSTYQRLLSIFILLPLFIGLYKKTLTLKKNIRRGFIGSPADMAMILYMLWLILLTSREPSLTASIRSSFYILIDMVLPYFMMSRCLSSFKDFYSVFLALSFSAILLSYLGIFEEIIRWKFYGVLPKHLGLDRYGVSLYDKRGGFLRISTTYSNPIAFGYFMVLAIGSLFYINHVNKFKKSTFFVTLSLFFGVLFLTFSRGALISTIVLIITYFYVKKSKYKKIIMNLSGIACVLFFVFMKPINNVSSVDEHGTFNYRIQLIETSISVIQQNLLSGSANFTENESMEVMRQGQGIIDIVNTYLQVVFSNGLIGLVLFLMIFILLLKKILTLINKWYRKDDKEAELLGCTIFSMILATMVMIGTTSSIDIIPIYYWSLLGIGSAYVRISKP